MTIGTKVRVIETGQIGTFVGEAKDGKYYINLNNKGWFKFDKAELELYI